ncbi:MAG: SDR family NAD(P)-dependent oxidoreductase [Candidatus Omnitrophica bacterium]|nr:SDR family NAD(P)-dependent oxidoreductase [Candidatus Omnitrophota bacterium]
MAASKSTARVVWITGAAGGLGRGLVDAFAAQGWAIAAAYHQTTFEPPTDHVWPVSLDVTVKSQVQSVCDRILARWGRIDLLINNAGLTADRWAGQMSEPDWDRVLSVNLKGAFLCAQSVLPAMLRQREGQIINIASFSGRVGAVGQSNYAAAKAGLLGLTESLARETGPGNIRFNAVLPGILATRMTSKLAPDQLARLISDNVLGRTNTVAEVSRFVCFLATLENVSGQLFQLDSRIARW